MHTDIYGSVKGGINSRIIKGNGTRRKNVNLINRISGFVCFFFFRGSEGALSPSPCRGRCPLTPPGALPLGPHKGRYPWTSGQPFFEKCRGYFEFKF